MKFIIGILTLLVLAAGLLVPVIEILGECYDSKESKEVKEKNGIKMNGNERHKLIMYIMRNVVPMYVALVLMAVKAVAKLDRSTMIEIIKKINWYTGAVEAGLINLKEVKQNLETELDLSLSEAMGRGSMFDEYLEEVEQ